jgi:RimJ/RimL family protein N-acetyltransferase
MTVTLKSVYRDPETALPLLYQLLMERAPHQSISHTKMPTLKDHKEFFDSKPYQCWYLVYAEGQAVGACYLSKQREIGIGILMEYRGRGYGKAAVQELMRKWPGRFLANINPANEPSIRMFTGMGFNHLQNTYIREQP